MTRAKKPVPTSAEIRGAVQTVAEDADRCFEMMSAGGDQLARRNYIRAYFAWVEAMCYYMRRLLLEKRYRKRVIRPADIPEFAALSEIKYSVTASGEAIAEPANTRTLDYIGFSVMASARSFGLKLSFNRGSKQGRDVVNALQIRDRITHPKSLAEVMVSDADLEVIAGFVNWFSGHLEILSNDEIKAKVRKEVGISKRTKKARTLVFDESHFKTKKR